ncbi:hypothetical protein [Streptomyces sp. NPDC059957]|uniref:hypothetical protein n=1 Tax=unclassified Streptomyces TaxID=2593676 RepID=UPI00364B02CA
MSTHRSRRIDRATAEQLLAGARPQPSGTQGASETFELADLPGASDRHEALADLLSAAAAPAGRSELSGEPQALAMFRAARLAPSAVSVPVSLPVSVAVPVPASPGRSLLTPATLLGAKVAVAVLAAALGGVAVAAGTGNLPTVLGGAPRHDRPAASPTPGTLVAAAPPPAASGRSSAAVPADLAELCRAFTRAPGPRPEEVLDEQRFAPLVAAAGGRSGVPDYCAPVRSGEPEPSGSAPAATPTRDPRGGKPTHPGKPDPSRRPVTPGPSAGEHRPGTRPPGHPGTVPSPPRRGVPTGRPPGANP